MECVLCCFKEHLAQREGFEPTAFPYISISYVSMLAESCQNLLLVALRSAIMETLIRAKSPV